jgi:hypothetical protein
MLPGLPQLAAAAVGGLAVAVGLVWWSILRPH